MRRSEAETIIDSVLAVTRVHRSHVFARSHRDDESLARHIAMYFVRTRLGDMSTLPRHQQMRLTVMAKLFACTHANVIWASRKIITWMKHYDEVKQLVEACEAEINSRIKKQKS